MGLEGIINVPIRIDSHELKTTIRSMEFFDRLTDEGEFLSLCINTFCHPFNRNC